MPFDVEEKSLDELLQLLTKDGVKHHVSQPCLARFLQANGGSVPEAFQHIQKMLKWRAEVHIDTRREELHGHSWPPGKDLPKCQDLMSHMCIDATNSTPQGHLIWVQCDGKAKLDKMMEKTDEEILEAVSLMCELRQDHLDRLSEQKQQLIKVIQVRDLGGVSVTAFVRDAAKLRRFGAVLNMVNLAYPETLERIIVFNLPSGFSLLWSAIRPLLNARVQQKFIFISNGPIELAKELVAIAGFQALEALAETSRRYAQTISQELVVRPGACEYAIYKVHPGSAVTWNFQVLPSATTLDFTALLVSQIVDATGKPMVNLCQKISAKHSAAGRFGPSKFEGMLFFIWHNDSWTQSRQVHGFTVDQLKVSFADAEVIGTESGKVPALRPPTCSTCFSFLLPKTSPSKTRNRHPKPSGLDDSIKLETCKQEESRASGTFCWFTALLLALFLASLVYMSFLKGDYVVQSTGVMVGSSFSTGPLRPSELSFLA